jgi:hypothetical protein
MEIAIPRGLLRLAGLAPTATLGPAAGIRATQQVAETLYAPDPDVRASQQVSEVLYETPAEVLASQQTVEVLWGPSPELWVTQQVIELLYTRPSVFYDCGEPGGSPLDDLCDKRNVLAWLEWDVDTSTTLTWES